MTTIQVPTHEDAQADGILRYMLARGRASRNQVRWLLGYVRRLRERSQAPEG